MHRRQTTRTRPKWLRRAIAYLSGLFLFLSLSGLPVLAQQKNPFDQFPALDRYPPPEITEQERVTQPFPGAPGLGDVEEFEAFADDFFTSQLAQKNIPGAAVAIVKDGEIFFSKGYGYANLEENIPVVADRTLFRVASVSKLLTVTTAMQLYEQGLFDLDDDVNEYLERFQLENPYPEPVTFSQLMMHIGGVTRRMIGLAAPTEEAMEPLGDYLEDHMPPITYPPGELYSYSNHAIALLGYLVEQISGQPFIEYADEQIFQPLEMRRSTFLQPPPPTLASDLAVGYQMQQAELQPVPYLYLNIAPAAALQTTATDMAHFMIAQLQLGVYGGEQILEPDTTLLMHETHFRPHPLLPGTSYGFRERFINNVRLIGHIGSLRGYSALLDLIPDQDIGIFIATNSFSGIGESFLTRFMDRYFPATETAQIDTVPPEEIDLNRFTGLYRDLEYPRHTLAKLAAPFQRIRITRNEDGLLVQTPSLFFRSQREPVQLVPLEPPLVFRRLEENALMAFEANEEGRIIYAYNPLFPKLGTYERVPWYAGVWVQLGLAVVCGIIFLVAAIRWPVVPIIERLRGKYYPQLQPLQPAWVLAGTVGILNLVFLIGFPLSIWLYGVWRVVYGLPISAIALLVLPLLTTAFTLGLMVYTGLVWRNPDWSWRSRSFYTLITLAAIAFVGFLVYWNLLGFQF